MQLQGELAAKGQVKKIYTGLFQGLATIAKHEGIRGIQRGLFSAVSIYLFDSIISFIDFTLCLNTFVDNMIWSLSRYIF